MTKSTKKDNVTPAVKQIKQDLRSLPQEIYDFFVKVTPIDSGNARKSTSLRNKTIHADYPYAQRLDQGWSKQAPKGMIEPTINFIERRLRQIMRKK